MSEVAPSCWCFAAVPSHLMDLLLKLMARGLRLWSSQNSTAGVWFLHAVKTRRVLDTLVHWGLAFVGLRTWTSVCLTGSFAKVAALLTYEYRSVGSGCIVGLVLEADGTKSGP
jgi:hypothetical protein